MLAFHTWSRVVAAMERVVKDRTFHEKEDLSWEATTPQPLKEIMQIIHCNVKRYQSRLS